ncbi:MAG: RNA methyltransferase [Candidatus Doudnabacteria bacterium]|nr:RNA methyltransferase [Candidatus Doudnabacteria bacterium]
MLVPGRNPVLEALRSQHRVSEIFLEYDIRVDPKIAEIMDIAKQKNIRIINQNASQLAKIAGEEPHQGVIAKVNLEAEKFSDKILHDRPGLYVYVREAQYEHNLGAIIRTAEVAGVAGVIVAPNQDLTGVVARISMGAIFHIPIYSGSLFPTIKIFRHDDLPVFALEINGTVTLFESDLGKDGLLIIGGEDRSISQEIALQCTQLIKIPQFGKVNSLNMSVAAALAMYEHVRKRDA